MKITFRYGLPTRASLIRAIEEYEKHTGSHFFLRLPDTKIYPHTERINLIYSRTHMINQVDEFAAYLAELGVKIGKHTEYESLMNGSLEILRNE